MDIVKGNMGWIEVVCGPMFSGKSEELIRRLRRAQIARQRVQIFKSVLDDRYAQQEIVSHSEARIEAQIVSKAPDILEQVEPRTEVVGIDEAHFFGMDLVEAADQLANLGKRVIVAGLETDYLGRSFEQVSQLMTVAEEVTKLLAICVRCGAPANCKALNHKQKFLCQLGGGGWPNLPAKYPLHRHDGAARLALVIARMLNRDWIDGHESPARRH